MVANYRSDIDGLRAVSIFAVIAYHIFPDMLPGGFAGVDVFFVVSGFLIAKILLSGPTTPDGHLAVDFSGFWKKRALRLLPALFSMLLGIWIFAFFIYRPAELIEFSKAGVSAIFYYSNFFFWKNKNYFEPGLEDSPLIHTWSLSVEEQFYLFAPVAIYLVMRFAARYFLVSVSVLVAVSFAINVVGPFEGTVAQFYLLPTRAWELGVGMICAHLAITNNKSYKLLIPTPIRMGAVGALCTFFLLYRETAYYPNFETLIPVCCAAILVVRPKNDIVGWLLSARPMVFIGLLSYSLYLWHQPLLSFAFELNGPIALLGDTVFMVLVLVTVGVVSYVSWRFVENPIRYASKSKNSLVFLLLFGVFVSTLYGSSLITQGFIGRYSEADHRLALLNFGQEGEFVERRFLELLKKDFSPEIGGKKVLLSGDSFAQDVVNLVERSAHSRDLDIATVYISARCGNLLVPWERMSDQIATSDRKYCTEENALISKKRFAELAAQADEIWLSSRWSKWQAELLGESIRAIRTLAPHATIITYGTKGFGPLDLNLLLNTAQGDRSAIKLTSAEYVDTVNDVIEEASASDSNSLYYDMQSLFCPFPREGCSPYVDGVGLITYDGEHLTEEGADYLGPKFDTDRLR